MLLNCSQASLDSDVTLEPEFEELIYDRSYMDSLTDDMVWHNNKAKHKKFGLPDGSGSPASVT